MDPSTVPQFIILLILLALSAFYSSAETALVTVNHVRVRTLIEEGSRKAMKLQKVLDDRAEMLSTILICNNVVNLSASALTTTIATRIWGNYAVSIATGVLTLTVLLVGEIVPKTAASLHADRLALMYAGPIYLTMRILLPVRFLIDLLARGLMRLIGIDPDAKIDQMTESELKTYVDVGHEDGVIETEEREMIYNVFEFGDAVAKDVMIPRIEMVTAADDVSYEELMGIFREHMYTRVPIHDDDDDNILGLVNIKDLILLENHENFSVKQILRPAHFTHEFKKTADLMVEMRKESNSIVFVLDEYGSCVGMITMEDLLEEIVGEIRDEYDEDELDQIRKVGERTYRIEGSMKLDDINDSLGTELHSEDYDSIGGMVIQLLDHLPNEKEAVETPEGIRLEVKEVQNNRIIEVEMILPEPVEKSSMEEESENE